MTQSGTQRRVLFVEDEAALTEAYARYFEKRLIMAFAASGEKAVAQVESFRPDLLVLDMRLPDTDGVDLLRRLRALQPGLPVVITTAYASMEPLMGVMGLEHSGFLVKPFELAELEKLIEAAK
jgi:DNA-binding response OmpR family regulator